MYDSCKEYWRKKTLPGLNTRTIIAVIVIISGRKRTIFVHFGDEGTVDLRMMALRSLEEKSVQCKFTC